MKMNQMQVSKVELIRQFRNFLNQNDTKELQIKRQNFLDWLQVRAIEPVQTFEMYKLNGNIIKSKKEVYQYFNKFHNTRNQIFSETRAEIDKLEFEKAVSVLCEVMNSLIRKNYHFAVFYSEGQRSPHIIIYDFYELGELNPLQQIKAQIMFWRKHFPFGTFQYCDTSLFDKEHPVQIEFAIHYKTGKPFNLLFEWIPENVEPVIKKQESQVKTKIKKFLIKTSPIKNLCSIHNFEMVECIGGWKCPLCIMEGRKCSH